MGVHRTEILQSPNGHLTTVDYIGVSEHVGNIRDVIVQLKYEEKRRLAVVLADLINTEREHFGDCDVVTWAPTTLHRRQQRGFDQSELIARHVAALSGMRHSRLLRRVNEGRQTGSGRTERLMRPSFLARPHLDGKSIWVIDDVMTTGATLRAAAEALVQQNAARITCIAVSYVP
jgi:predicted amidophosphoribosyltransferase